MFTCWTERARRLRAASAALSARRSTEVSRPSRPAVWRRKPRKREAMRPLLRKDLGETGPTHTPRVAPENCQGMPAWSACASRAGCPTRTPPAERVDAAGRSAAAHASRACNWCRHVRGCGAQVAYDRREDARLVPVQPKRNLQRASRPACYVGRQGRRAHLAIRGQGKRAQQDV